MRKTLISIISYLYNPPHSIYKKEITTNNSSTEKPNTNGRGPITFNFLRDTLNPIPESARRIKNLGLLDKKNIAIIYSETKRDYFRKFNKTLNKADVLWTKPSELSFYVGLGIPIIMAPSIGAQERFNKKWLSAIGAGVSQKNPKYAKEWIYRNLTVRLWIKNSPAFNFQINFFKSFITPLIFLQDKLFFRFFTFYHLIPD